MVFVSGHLSLRLKFQLDKPQCMCIIYHNQLVGFINASDTNCNTQEDPPLPLQHYHPLPEILAMCSVFSTYVSLYYLMKLYYSYRRIISKLFLKICILILQRNISIFIYTAGKQIFRNVNFRL